MYEDSGFKTWLEYFGLSEYPRQLKLQGSEQVITPDKITSTGRVYHNKNYLNIWWYEPVTCVLANES